MRSESGNFVGSCRISSRVFLIRSSALTLISCGEETTSFSSMLLSDEDQCELQPHNKATAMKGKRKTGLSCKKLNGANFISCSRAHFTLQYKIFFTSF